MGVGAKPWKTGVFIMYSDNMSNTKKLEVI